MCIAATTSLQRRRSSPYHLSLSSCHPQSASHICPNNNLHIHTFISRPGQRKGEQHDPYLKDLNNHASCFNQRWQSGKQKIPRIPTQVVDLLKTQEHQEEPTASCMSGGEDEGEATCWDAGWSRAASSTHKGDSQRGSARDLDYSDEHSCAMIFLRSYESAASRSEYHLSM
jgi:hypothetical protein